MIVLGRDQYGDWQCKYCGRYIDDTRALRRRDVGDFRVPVCVACDVMLPIWGEDRHGIDYLQNRAEDFYQPKLHVGASIKAPHAATDGNSDRYPGVPVYRVYVTAKGGLSVRKRRDFR